MPQSKERHTEYVRERRALKKTGTTVAPTLGLTGGLTGAQALELLDGALAERMKVAEQFASMATRAAVIIDLVKLDAISVCPALAKAAIDMADILDAPDQRSQHTAATGKLIDLMRDIRSLVAASRQRQSSEPQEVEDGDSKNCPEVASFRPAGGAV